MKRQKIYPRLCIIKNWGTAYGFNLTSRKFIDGQEYHYINDVTGGSSAMMAGLEKHDRVVEVNGVYIGNENHKQIVKRVLMDPKSVSLLVLKPEDYEIFKQNNLPTSTLIPFATIQESPDAKPTKSTSISNDPTLSKENNICLEAVNELKDLVLRSDSWTDESPTKSQNMNNKHSHHRHSYSHHHNTKKVSSGRTNENVQKEFIRSVQSKPLNSVQSNGTKITLDKSAIELTETNEYDSPLNLSELNLKLEQSKNSFPSRRKNPRVQSKYSELDLKEKMRMINEL